MAIPWIDDEPPLYCNRKSAEDGLYSLERHLKQRPDVAEKHCQVLEATVIKGYIRKLEPGEVNDGPSWYLPHFPVVREDKEMYLCVFMFLLKLPQAIEYTKQGFLKKLATLFDPLQMLAHKWSEPG